METVTFPERWYLYINLHNVVSLKILIFFSIALRASYHTISYFFPFELLSLEEPGNVVCPYMLIEHEGK